MTDNPFKAITIKEPLRQPDLRNAFRTIGSTPVSRDWLIANVGINQDGLTLIEVLIMKLYKRALEEEDYAALDRILKFNDEGGSGAALVNVNINNQMEHGAQAIFERLNQAIEGDFEEIPDF